MKGVPKANLKMQLHQAQVMTPQLLQSIRLLQLSALEMEMEIRQALDSNLMLEAVDEGSSADDGEAGDDGDASPPTSAESAGDASVELSASSLDSDSPTSAGSNTDSLETEVTGCDMAAAERVEADFDWSSAESWSSGEPRDEDGEPFMNRIADAPEQDPRLAALTQLQLVIDDARTAELAAAIIDSVDDNGYLTESLETIVARFPTDWQLTVAELETVLRIVQSVEPTGFAARDLRECLLLQLGALPRQAGRALARDIVNEFLPELAALSDPALMQKMLEAGITCTLAELAQARALIRGLDPRPGAALMAPAQAVVPDVLITGGAGAWRVELNPETLPRVRVNRRYEQYLGGGASGGAGAWRALKDQLNEARWLVRGIEMRQETLLKTARVVFERQKQFLRLGEEGMVPLTLREVAEQIGMHESTVCRVVANKHVLTPWGIYPLKDFFPTQITGAEGDTSGTAVRAMIRKIIDGENSAHPLCDGEVAALLARRGIRVARRTVAKYREAMRIAPASIRAQTVTNRASVRGH